MIDYHNINTFIHEYDFPIHDLVLPYKEDILNQFKSNLNLNLGNSTSYTNSDLENLIIPKFLDIINNNYEVDSLQKPPKLWIYVQDDKFNRSIFHHHISTSTINSVFYIDIPQEGGEIEFIFEQNTFGLKPKKDKIYTFPYWVFHRPLPQKDQNPRICFNLEYFCKQRPLHKPTKILW